MNKIKLIAIIGKSASGKDHLVEMAIRDFPKLHRVIHYTTRPFREGERLDIDYIFTDEKTIKHLEKENKLLTSKVFNNWYYALGKDCFDEEKINIGVFNIAELNILIHTYKDKFDLHVIMAHAPDTVRFERSLDRLEPFDGKGMAEIARREESDKYDFDKKFLNDIPYKVLWTYGGKHNLEFNKYFKDSKEGAQIVTEIYNHGYMANLVESLGYSD